MLHDEDAEIGDVLLDLVGKGIVVTHHGGREDAPELAVIGHRIAEFVTTRIKWLFHRLELLGGLDKQIGFVFTRVRDDPSRLTVRLRRIVHST